jgi:lipoprotein NlpD
VYLSAYAHSEKLLVKEGEVVTAGQKIALMGRTGTQRDQLHFEIRRNGKPVDPIRFLPKR